LKTLLTNIKHLPSTIAGGVIAGTGVALGIMDPNNPIGAVIQQLAAVNPKVAAGVGILTGLAVIVGVGPKKS